MRSSETEEIAPASGVPTKNVDPNGASPGIELMVGRGPLNRYGGEKISALNWGVGPTRPLPATRTRPSNSSTAVSWYRRPFCCVERVVQVFVCGDHTSAASTEFA